MPKSGGDSMARAQARLTPAGTTNMSRRRGRQLSKSERRDVRWALEQAPAGNVRAMDVHGVYVVYNHHSHKIETKSQPVEQRGSGEDVDMRNVQPRRRKRRESEARLRKKDERWHAKMRKRQLLEVLPIVGAWARQQQLREVRDAAAVATARQRRLVDEKLGLERELAAAHEERRRLEARARAEEIARARAEDRVEEAWAQVARWKRRAERRDSEQAEMQQPARMDDERAPKRATSPASSTSSGVREPGTPPAKRGHHPREDVRAGQRRLLEEASEALAAKGSGRGKGKGGGASRGGRSDWEDGGRGGAQPPPRP